ncbi:MAG TPA: KUP/HAK/KT family potassium transporter, partial [Acidobacteriota bacterium]|nr:KUP/HAK/KT family potassium transporter [Acidobacteriota bacterium]
LSAAVFCVNVVYLLANIYKIPHGGYWSLIIAAIPFALILLYTRGQKRLYQRLRPMDRAPFLAEYANRRENMNPIEGTALFFSRGLDKVPPYMVNTMFENGVVYEDNIIVSLVRRDDPFGIAWFFRDEQVAGLRIFEIQIGYMEIPNMEQVFREASIFPRTIFYGVEDISTRSFIWKVFSVIKRLTPSFVQFYRMPPHLLHGVVTRVEM